LILGSWHIANKYHKCIITSRGEFKFSEILNLVCLICICHSTPWHSLRFKLQWFMCCVTP